LQQDAAWGSIFHVWGLAAMIGCTIRVFFPIEEGTADETDKHPDADMLDKFFKKSDNEADKVNTIFNRTWVQPKFSSELLMLLCLAGPMPVRSSPLLTSAFYGNLIDKRGASCVGPGQGGQASS
jgi:hypothetical protein